MAIANTGPISLSTIQTEFGGSNPISMSEYYRGGAYVTTNNTGVPTSGAITFGVFRGTTATDLEPAAVNWTNIFASNYFDGSADGQTNVQTISTITEPITLSVNFALQASLTPKTTLSGHAYVVQTTAGGQTANNAFWSNGSQSGKTVTLVVEPNANVHFFAGLSCFNNFDNTGSSAAMSGVVTVTNATTGTVLDTFSVDLDVADDGTIE